MMLSIDTQEEILTLDGVNIRLDLLKVLVDPDESAFYQFQRDGSVINVRRFTIDELPKH